MTQEQIKKKRIKRIERSIGRINAILAGVSIASNLKGLRGDEVHYDDMTMGLKLIDNEIWALAEYLIKQ